MLAHKAANPVSTLRILAVEDEFLLSEALADDLRTAGHQVIGPFGNLPDALEAARREAFDFAVLDVNLRGTMVYPLADQLTERGVPFLFLTGYGRADMPARFAAIARVPKPYEARILLQEVERQASRARASSSERL
jgi:DNA-binding response OmpR family regulator